MQIPTVSIIVPVYNASNTLRRCVDSILKQEYTDFELLLVDDGSQDESSAICDAYARQDARVQVIHKENGGVSAARNDALDRARGTFLQFVDSDDWIASSATKLLVRAAQENNCDLVIADFYRVAGDRVSHRGEIEEEGVMSQERFAAHMMDNPADYYYGVLWNKLYRRELVEKYHIRMDQNISWCEDFMFNLEYIRHAETFCALHAPIYYYIKRKGSLASQSINLAKIIKMKFMVFEYYNNFYKHVLDEEDYEKNRIQVYRFLLDAAGDGMVPPSILPGATKLGDERRTIFADGLNGEGVLMESYRDRKLLERYLETAAVKNDLTLIDTVLLLALSYSHKVYSRKELADFTHTSYTSLALSLRKLASRGILRTEEVRGIAKNTGRKVAVTLLPAADPVLEDIAAAQRDYESVKFTGFSDGELTEYARLSEKIKGNIQKTLS